MWTSRRLLALSNLSTEPRERPNRRSTSGCASGRPPRAGCCRGRTPASFVAAGRLLYQPGAAEVGASRRPDLARPVELSVARRASSSQASALLVDQTTLGGGQRGCWVRSQLGSLLGGPWLAYCEQISDAALRRESPSPVTAAIGACRVAGCRCSRCPGPWPSDRRAAVRTRLCTYRRPESARRQTWE
jgi:hypothetical protein